MFIGQLQLASERRYLSRITVRVAGIPANDHDVRQFETVTMIRYGLYADLSGKDAFAQCRYRRLIHGIREVDLQYYAEDYKTLKQAYLVALADPIQGDAWQRFKRAVAPVVHYKWILEAAMEFIQLSVPAAVQWLSFDERMLLTTNKDVSKEIQAYIANERVLASRTYEAGTLSELAEIVGVWFQDFSFADDIPRPRFGPGATYEVRGTPTQYRKVLACINDKATIDTLCEYFWCEDDEISIGAYGDANWKNRIIFVPKNALKHRIISSEPTWLSWLQQAIKEPVYRFVENSTEMFTWFSDQSRSREFALRGSVDGCYATVDFSSASDSVTVELVRRIFEHTCLWEPLLLTRSTHAELPDGTILALAKFAPMGSATCFCTMDIIILSMCELAVRRALGRAGQTGDYVVYGDDVVIRSDAYPAFAQISCDLGFDLNEQKSFVQSNGHACYREACGIEAYAGVDVTPARYSRFQEPLIACNPLNAGVVTSYVDLINKFVVETWLPCARSVCIEVFKASITACKSKRLAQSVWDTLFRVDRSDFIAGQSGPIKVVVPDGTATNYRSHRRYRDHGRKRDPWYQKSELLVSTLRSSVDTKVQVDEEILYHLWFFQVESDRAKLDQYERTSFYDEVPHNVQHARGLLPPKWCRIWFSER